MKNKLTRIGWIFTIVLLVGCVSNSKKVENFRTYAKAYGYVKYFHPSDEAVQIDWAKFAAYGAAKVEKCRSKEQLAEALNELFRPVAPSVRFVVAKNAPVYDLKQITPDNASSYRLTYWQHFGLGAGMKTRHLYKSIRVNSGLKGESEKLFDAQPEFEKVIVKEIGNRIYCLVPQVLYRNDQSTYPVADAAAYKKLKAETDTFHFNPAVLSHKVGNVVNVYNVFQHFYPYFDVVDVQWDDELKKALTRCITDVTDMDHLITLEKFTAPLKDGHISVISSAQKYFCPSLFWEWVEGKLVITHNFGGNDDIHAGDIVSQINGVSADKYFEEINSQISAGTKGWLNSRAQLMSLLGEKGSVMKLTINEKPFEVTRQMSISELYSDLNRNSKIYRQFGEDTWYLNMGKIPMDTINKLLPALSKSKAIICDARGYPNGNHEFITHLMQKDDTTSAWMQVPQIIYPDHENVAGYFKANWVPMMKAQKPYLGDKKIIYIIDGSAISYAESCLGYIEGYHLATLVGQPTAGTNGDVNPFLLPGGYTVAWTGLKVLKHNGTQHHGVGILPNIYVTKTIQGIKEGRDEFLDKALELAKQ